MFPIRFLTYADLFGLESSLANKLSVSFGGGVSRIREICGAVSGMAMIVGLYYPESVAEDLEIRTKVYRTVQKMAEAFKEKHQSIVCGQLLTKTEADKKDPIPSVRTTEYYAQRPCSKYVAEAAFIIGNFLKEEASTLSQ
ncbi:MAG: C-GCAxxG-C-C family protein [Tannerellaceae bacterium]|nr:C-GCAxxG-C-C family protein [Tannerellaceae bacterium]